MYGFYDLLSGVIYLLDITNDWTQYNISSLFIWWIMWLIYLRQMNDYLFIDDQWGG